MSRIRIAAALRVAALTACLAVAAPAGAQEAALEPEPEPEAAATVGPRCAQHQVDSRLFRHLYVTDQALSVEGRRLVYESWTLVGSYYVIDDVQIHLYDPSTRARTLIASPDFVTSGLPRISADGTTVVFAAKPTADGPPAVSTESQHVRALGPAEASATPEIIVRPSGDEVFSYDVATGVSRQVSPPADGAESVPVGLSEDGSRILYWAETDDDVYGSLGPYALRVYDDATGVTNEVVPSIGYGGLGGHISLSPDGAAVAFRSDADLLGDNPEGNLEVYLYDLDATRLEQVTHTAGDVDNGALWFTDDGASLEITSEADLVGSGAAGRGRYLYDIAGRTFTLRSERGPLGTISEDGSHIATTFEDDPVGTNGDRESEFELFDVASGTSTQLTETRWRGESPYYRDLSPDGTVLAATTWAEQPSSPNRLVLATGCDPAPRPDATIATAPEGSFVGDDVYWALGSARQKQRVVAPPRSTTRFTVELQNDRTATDVFRLDGDVTTTSGYRVRFLRGDVDVTQQVEAGTYFTEAMPAGAAAVVTIEVTTAGRRATGPNVVIDLTARSWTNPIASDTVRAKVHLG